MTRIHAQSTWDDDITWSSASRGTEGVLVIHSSGRLVGLIHSRPSSHAWGRDRMERGLIVVIGGVDSVDNCRAAAHDGESGWGQVRGPAVDDAQGGVGESHESPGAAVPAQSVHMLVRRQMWETTSVVGPGNPGESAEQVVPAAWETRGGDEGRLPTALLWTRSGVLPDFMGLVGTHKIVHRLWICGQTRGEGPSSTALAGRSRSGLGGRTGWGEACGKHGDA